MGKPVSFIVQKCNGIVNKETKIRVAIKYQNYNNKPWCNSLKIKSEFKERYFNSFAPEEAEELLLRILKDIEKTEQV